MKEQTFVTIRLPKQVLKEIKYLVIEEKYLNVSEFIRTAIRYELDKHKTKEEK